MNTTQDDRPGFIKALSNAYSMRGKSVVLLTGDTLDLFWSRKAKSFIPLQQTLYQELSDKFVVVKFDAAIGLDFYDDKDKAELLRVCKLADVTAGEREKMGDVQAAIDANMHNPLPGLVLLRGISDGFTRAARANLSKTKTGAAAGGEIRPLLVVVQFAGSLFPAGDFDRLSEADRQRLITFLDWINDPVFTKTENLVVLVADSRSDINSRILALPSAQQVEVDLPEAPERARFVANFIAANPETKLERSQEEFTADCAGLRLTAIEDLLEGGSRSNQAVTRQDVLREVNQLLTLTLGDVIKVNMPEHSTADIIGNATVTDIIRKVFARCEDPETAVSSLIVAGPNGAGKTFMLEAFAADSGRIVIELAGLRGKYFGETDRFFEMLHSQIRTYGKILILVDEAHTAFGSVHDESTHETEKRLAGNIIKMMGDPRFRGKVLWGLMTSRPDKLDPDIKSRSPVQIPIFDPEGPDRQKFVAEMFARKKVALSEPDLAFVLSKTEHYSARDFRDLVSEVKADNMPVSDVLANWSASTAIVRNRRLQMLIAAQHCSYPKLLPEVLRKMEPEAIQDEIDALKLVLHT